MPIFIANLPAVAAARDIAVFAGVSNGGIVRIIKKQDGVGDSYRYALVLSRSEREGQRLIARLHRRELRRDELERRAAERRISPPYRC